MEKESICRRTTTIRSYREETSKQTLRKFEGFWIGHKKEDKSRIKGIFSF